MSQQAQTYNQSRDLLALNYVHAPEFDAGNATVATYTNSRNQSAYWWRAGVHHNGCNNRDQNNYLAGTLARAESRAVFKD